MHQEREEIVARLDGQDEYIRQIEIYVKKSGDELAVNTAATESIRKDLIANTAATNAIAADTAAIVDFFGKMERGAKVMCRSARAIDWVIEKIDWLFFKLKRLISPFIVAGVLVYVWVHHSVPEWVLAVFKVLQG